MAKKDGSSGAKIGRGTRSPSSKMYRATGRAEKNKALRIARDRRLKAKAATKKMKLLAKLIERRTTFAG